MKVRVRLRCGRLCRRPGRATANLAQQNLAVAVAAAQGASDMATEVALDPNGYAEAFLQQAVGSIFFREILNLARNPLEMPNQHVATAARASEHDTTH